ncbi:MAG: hypothetical protein AB7F86_16240 [Bdellovibrionales bacterium]
MVNWRNARQNTIALLIALASVLFSYRTFAQEDTPTRAFKSEVDELMTVQKISVLPFTDNLQGIYSRPLEAYFISLVEKMHRWDYIPAQNTGPLLSPEEFEASPEKVKSAAQGLNVDAFFSARVVKGPNGVMIHLSLFLTKDGKLLAQAILKDYKQFGIESLKEQTQTLLKEIVARIPYAGRVLSRESNRVTVNLGSRDGIQAGHVLSVVQIIQAQRHPKFNFLIKTEKEIVGKIRVLKVDDTLSFGMIVTEKERGAIQKNSKIGAIDFIVYNNQMSLNLTPTPEEELTQREDSGIAFGKDAKPWQPVRPPSIGAIGGQFGLGQFNGNRQSSTLGALEGKNSIVPSIALMAELWITQEWTIHARLKQAILPVSNPSSSSSPSTLNQSMTYYEGGAGYTMRFGPHVWSPVIEPYFGFFYYRLYVDDSSPRAFTTVSVSGTKFGLRGSTPVGDSGKYGVGGDFSMTPIRPSVSESPSASGASAKGSAVQFGIFGYQRMGERLRLQANLDFEMYSASFSNTSSSANPATSVSHRHLTLSGGLLYMF